MYRLKKNQEEFEVVDGPFEGRRYRHGETYRKIPPGERHRFEQITTEAPQTKKNGRKEGGSK